MSAFLWILQTLLFLAFLLAGTLKLVLPPSQLVAQGMDFVAQLPLAQVRWIGALEVLGALGLFAPPILGLDRRLSGLAALGLALLMVGAVVVQLREQEWLRAVPPILLGIAAVLVARARLRPS